MRKRIGIGVALLGASLFVMIPSVRADVTIVSTIKVKDDDPEEKDTPKKYTQTTYYKGTKRRIEEKGEVRIADSDAGKEYTLDAKKKTYSVRALPVVTPPAKPEAGADKDASKPETAGKDSKEETLSLMKSEVDVKPIGKEKTIAGKKARGLRYAISLHPTQPKIPLKPDAAQAVKAAQDAEEPLPTIVINGEQWMTDEVVVPKGLQGESLLPALLNGKAFRSGLTDSDREKITAQLTGLDLSGVLHIKVTFPKNAAKENQDADVMYSRDVTSISDAALDDALFTIPADYTMVKSMEQAFQEGLSKKKEKP